MPVRTSDFARFENTSAEDHWISRDLAVQLLRARYEELRCQVTSKRADETSADLAVITSDFRGYFFWSALESCGLNPLQSEFVCELLAVELLPTSVIVWRIFNFAVVCMTLRLLMKPKQ